MKWIKIEEARPQKAGLYMVAGSDGGKWMNVLLFNDAGDIDDPEEFELPPVEWWAEPPTHPAEEIQE